ncbi:serine/threonine-protein kinase [Myxococcota bacterium]
MLVRTAGSVALALLVVLLIRDILSETPIMWTSPAILGLIGVATAMSFAPWVAREVARLRVAELVIVLSFVTFLGLRTFRLLAEDPTAGIALWNRSLLQFALIMGFYGLFVLNSGRRAALVMLPIAATPVVVAWVAGLPRSDLVEGTLLIAFAFAVSVVAALMVGFLLNRMAEKTAETQYEMIEKIGSGGMGDVWLARHRSLARPAAIKLIRPDAISTDVGAASRALRRFEREARTTAALRSPNTVEVYDFGVAGDGTFYYVMEYLDGWDLDQLIRAHGPLSPERAIYLLDQVCESLADAHGKSLIHRDIKPANLHVSRMGTWCDFMKVLDFGLVKPEESPTPDADISLDGGFTGTPAYISPEMAVGGQNIDARSDIYGLGCVAYWMLTGRLVFDETTPMGMAVAHASVEPTPPSVHTELDIPEELDRIVLKCLAKDPTARFQNVGELQEALAACPTKNAWDRRRAERWWTGHRPMRQAAANIL